MSKDRVLRKPALTEKALRELIARALRKGYFRESFHAEHEHPEREISLDDVIHGLESKDWTLVRTPDFDEKHGTWEYLVKTKNLEGDELHIKIAAFPAENRVEVITRW